MMSIPGSLDFHSCLRNFHAARESGLALAHNDCLLLLHFAERDGLIRGDRSSGRTLAFYASYFSSHAISRHKVKSNPGTARQLDGDLTCKFKISLLLHALANSVRMERQGRRYPPGRQNHKSPTRFPAQAHFVSFNFTNSLIRQLVSMEAMSFLAV
jgi:hypothetical protein